MKNACKYPVVEKVGLAFLLLLSCIPILSAQSLPSSLIDVYLIGGQSNATGQGYVRNIIGDRVMVVFPVNDCFVNAVNCAITINHISQMINDIFTYVDFHCGIGIDYGEMRVIKVGIERKGDENTENKGLVWVGKPANFASRLTDFAGKTIEDEFYNVTGEFYHCGSLGLPTFLSQPRKGWIKESRKLTAEQLANKLYYSSTNGLNISIHNISSFERIVEKYKYRPILISDKIYTEYIKQNSQNSKYWRQETREIKDITYPLAELI